MNVGSIVSTDTSKALSRVGDDAGRFVAKELTGLRHDALHVSTQARQAAKVVDTTIEDIAAGRVAAGTKVRFVGSLEQRHEPVALGDGTMLLHPVAVWDRSGRKLPTDLADSTFKGQQDISARNALNLRGRAELLQYGKYVPLEGTVGTTTAGPMVFLSKIEGQDTNSFRNMSDIRYRPQAQAPSAAPVAPVPASYVTRSGATVTRLANGSRQIVLTGGDTYQVAADQSFRFKKANEAGFGPVQHAQGMAPWAYALMG